MNPVHFLWRLRRVAGLPRSYETLEGTPYSRYALPVDYPPSRDFNPRWGGGHPPIPSLYDWFCGHAEAYRRFLNEMREAARNLSDIPMQFDEARLPVSVWYGVAYSHVC